MNKKILQPQIVSLLAEASGMSKRQSEIFLKAFFNTLSEGLLSHDVVKVKNLGTFKVSRVEARKSVDVSTGEAREIPAHKKIVFVPQKSLAEKVNSEFAWLDIVELSDNLSNEELSLVTDEFPSENEPVAEMQELPFMAKKSEESLALPPAQAISIEETEDEDNMNESEEKNKKIRNEAEDEGLGETLEKEYGEIEPVEPFGPIGPDTPDLSEPQPEGNMAKVGIPGFDHRKALEEMERRSRRRFRAGLFWGLLGAAAIICIGFFFLYFFLQRHIDDIYGVKPGTVVAVQPAPAQTENVEPVHHEASETNQTEAGPIEPEEVATTVETPQSDVLAVDAITDTRYLTTMAKDYYGNYHLWPYIYKENEKKLGHPDRIKPGTKIVVPSLAKYGVDPNNPEDIKKAKALGVDIYNRYKSN